MHKLTSFFVFFLFDSRRMQLIEAGIFSIKNGFQKRLLMD